MLRRWHVGRWCIDSWPTSHHRWYYSRLGRDSRTWVLWWFNLAVYRER